MTTALDFWTVLCSDGVDRSDGPFPTEIQARQWATWGHVCFAGHTFRRLRGRHLSDTSDATEYGRKPSHGLVTPVGTDNRPSDIGVGSDGRTSRPDNLAAPSVSSDGAPARDGGPLQSPVSRAPHQIAVKDLLPSLAAGRPVTTRPLRDAPGKNGWAGRDLGDDE